MLYIKQSCFVIIHNLYRILIADVTKKIALKSSSHQKIGPPRQSTCVRNTERCLSCDVRFSKPVTLMNRLFLKNQSKRFTPLKLDLQMIQWFESDSLSKESEFPQLISSKSHKSFLVYAWLETNQKPLTGELNQSIYWLVVHMTTCSLI